VPYRAILDGLLAQVPGSQTALLLDGQGEVVVGAGDLDERHRLIGAYQGIALGIVSRTASRFGIGGIDTLAWRHADGSVILATLHDGYYIVLALGPRTPVAMARHRCEKVRDRLNQEI
jgi:predicted regulator of Ras-like GTPase activity (Roadblock/LC7/MglB family)